MNCKPALLIGGKSSRMGKNKGLLNRSGQPLGQYLADLLQAETGEQPVLLGEGDIGLNTSHYRCLPDPEKGRGPLAGLVSFIQAYPDSNLILLPTDLYAMDATALSWMIQQARQAEKPVLWPKQPQRKHGEPLAAVYRKEAFPTLLDAWNKGKKSPCQAIPHAMRLEPEIPESLRLAFVNINTPEELEAVKRGLKQQFEPGDRQLLFPGSTKRAH